MTKANRPTGLDFVQGKTRFDIIVELLREVGDDIASRDRIALATSFSHGESAWVAETAWQAAHRGLHVKREASVGGVPRVDLEVAGTAVEFKSTFASWALNPATATEWEKWLGADVDKLKAGKNPGVVVVTTAALTMGVAHQRQAFKVMYGDPAHGDLDPQQLLEEGVRAIDTVLRPRCAQVHRVDLHPGTVPLNGGSVFLTALVGAVNMQAVRAGA
ncbi:hypothetical protein [Knoellia locipacati]|uniref:hypothetical protein n=1 Tax=Knoellia locipacati TaxID=882824 RepID=UPI0011BDE0C0|nr:hypothetical protein [Knoellia locipacati]